MTPHATNTKSFFFLFPHFSFVSPFHKIEKKEKKRGIFSPDLEGESKGFEGESRENPGGRGKDAFHFILSKTTKEKKFREYGV